MSETFKLQPEECSHEHLGRAEDTTYEHEKPHFLVWCRDCGEDQLALPEFLRARAEEAIAQANAAIEVRRRVSTRGNEPDYDPPIAWEDLGTPACLVGPEFVLRESAAKIALVNEFEDFLSVAESDDRTDQRVTLHFALVHLAASYRDHPDYQVAWAPYEDDPS